MQKCAKTCGTSVVIIALKGGLLPCMSKPLVLHQGHLCSNTPQVILHRKMGLGAWRVFYSYISTLRSGFKKNIGLFHLKIYLYTYTKIMCNPTYKEIFLIEDTLLVEYMWFQNEYWAISSEYIPTYIKESNFQKL